MPRLSLCLMWMDVAVYGWGLVCLISLFTAGYSLRRLFSPGAGAALGPGWAEDPRTLPPAEPSSDSSGAAPAEPVKAEAAVAENDAAVPPPPEEAAPQPEDLPAPGFQPAAAEAQPVPEAAQPEVRAPAGGDTMALAKAALEEAFNAPFPAGPAEDPQLSPEDPESVAAAIPGVEELLAAVTETPPDQETFTTAETPAQAPAPRQKAPSAAAEVQAPAAAAPGPAENFIRGIYEGISGLESRLKDVESKLNRHHPGTDFALKFLEDLSLDMDNLDKAKIKARLEFLVADLKK